jgi:HlyD family secretion protein
MMPPARQNFDNAKAAAHMAQARVELNRKALDLTLKGPRQEDIDQAEAQLRADEAQLALLRQQFDDAQLVAPIDAVVRSRLMEPGRWLLR